MDTPVAEPWTRYEDSLQWRIHHAYYQQRGASAWLDHEIPYQSTSNIGAVQRHVRIFAALVAERPSDDRPLWVLEVGAGSGHFAANFLKALARHDPKLAARTRYVTSDYAPKSLADLARSRHLGGAIAAGQVVPALFDINVGGSLRDPGGEPLSLPDGTQFSLVVANYVCSAIAMTPLQKEGSTWSELYVETRERSPETRLSDDSLAALAARPNALANLPRTNAWKPLNDDLRATFGGFHGDIIAAATANYDIATLFYPRRYFDFLRTIGPLSGDALIVTCDYGSIRSSVIRGHFGRPPQHYGNSLGQRVVFALFDPFAAAAGFEIARSSHELDNVHIAIIARGRMAQGVRATFDAGRLFGRNESDTISDYANAARHFAAHDEQLAAMRCYQACVAIDPDNAQVRYDLAELALADQRAELALGHLLAGQALEPDDYDWDFMLGRAYFQCGDSRASRDAYERSLAAGPHPQTYLNLGALHRDADRPGDALRCFRAALALDPEEARATAAIALIEAATVIPPSAPGT